MKEKMEIGVRKINEIQTKQVKNFIRSKPSTAGITLIALVITIIVLLILAAVSIATLTGENGILTQAGTARDKTKEAEIKERAELILLNWNFQKGSGKNFEEYLNEHFDTVVNNGDGTYTVTLEGYEMTVDEDGNVILKGEAKEEEKVELTDIYVTLYTDGTLGFSNDDAKIEGKTVQESYGNIKGRVYSYSEPAPWNNNTTIVTVNMVNKIVPTDIGYWFYYLNNLTNIENIGNLVTDNVTNMNNLFEGCTSLTNVDVSKFNTKNVTNMSCMFWNCNSLINLDVTRFNTSNVVNIGGIFGKCSSLINIDVSNFDTSNVTSMSSMFFNCSKLTTLDVTNFDTNNVTSMGFMFSSCSKLTSLDVTNFDTNNVISMSSMFSNCSKLINLDVSKFNTSNVKDMVNMFGGCSGLSSLDLSNFDISNVTTMSNMFSNCSGLTSLDVSNFDTSNVTNMNNMFKGCGSLTNLDISNFNTSNVSTSMSVGGDKEGMESMFSGCSNLTSLDVSNFDTSKVIKMQKMFENCNKLGVIYADKQKFVISEGAQTTNMFTNCGTNVLVSKSDNTLFGYQIEKGRGWSGTTTLLRTENAGRASSVELLKLDPTKTYTVSMNNSNYYYGIQGADEAGNKLTDSGWIAPSSTQTITNHKKIALNFKYQSAGTTTITDDMVNEIMSSFTITMVE